MWRREPQSKQDKLFPCEWVNHTSSFFAPTVNSPKQQLSPTHVPQPLAVKQPFNFRGRPVTLLLNGSEGSRRDGPIVCCYQSPARTRPLSFPNRRPLSFQGFSKPYRPKPPQVKKKNQIKGHWKARTGCVWDDEEERLRGGGSVGVTTPRQNGWIGG